MIRAIALDDEPPALRVLESFCADTPFVELQRTFVKPSEALKYLHKFPVELLFLDVQMPSISGLDFFKSLAEPPLVIFTTAYSEYAVEGFNVNALDYLLKPFTFERFTQVVNKAQEVYALKIGQKHAANNAAAISPTIMLRSEYALVKIAVEDILFVESIDDYATVHLVQGKSVTSRITLKAVHELLPMTNFMRIHRSFVVNTHKITAVRNKIAMLEGREIPIGPSYERDFFAQFGE